jgi:hypothetical protein
MKAFTILAAGVVLSLAAVAPAQPAPEMEQMPESEQMPDSEQMLVALRGAVTAMRTELFAPGPPVEGWNQGGADPDSDLRAAGADSHFFLLRSDDGPSVVLLTGRSIAALAPEEWRIADSYGSSAVRLANPFVQFMAITPRYVLAVRANSRRVASVDCADPVANAILYERPDAPESPRDVDVPIWFRLALLAAEDQVVCSRYDPVGEGYRIRAFLPDGRSLPQLDDDSERVTIVPAAPLETLLRLPDAAAPTPA